MRGCLTWFAAITIATMACSSGSGGSGNGGVGSGDGGTMMGSSGGGSLGATCSTSSPCANGLTCAQSGNLLDRCTADCSSNSSLCSQFGSSVCMGLVQCALVCTSSAQCPDQGECVPLTNGQSACITNPDGPPGAAAPPNGACWNVGGGFGDTIPNGGYRCTPSTSGMLGTSVDQCNNGKWTTGTYNCTCQSNGQASQCFDITSLGSAQCSYAVTACAQCVPGSGCQ